MGKTQENGTMIDQDMLGPCEPGTAINLDGIVWNESKGGIEWTMNVIQNVNDFCI